MRPGKKGDPVPDRWRAGCFNEARAHAPWKGVPSATNTGESTPTLQ